MEAQGSSGSISTQKALLKLLDSIRYKFCLQDQSFIFQAKAQLPLFYPLYPHIYFATEAVCPCHAVEAWKDTDSQPSFWEVDYIHQLGLEEFWRLLFGAGMGVGWNVREGILYWLLQERFGFWVLFGIFIPGLGCRAGNWIKTGTALWLHLLFFRPWDKLAPKPCFWNPEIQALDSQCQ